MERKCDGAENPALAAHMRTKDRKICDPCAAEDRKQTVSAFMQNSIENDRQKHASKRGLNDQSFSIHKKTFFKNLIKTCLSYHT